MSALSYIKQQIIIGLTSRAEYRFSFFLFIFLSVVLGFLSIFVTYAVYDATGGGVPGWSFYEITFMIGVYTFIRGIYEMFFVIRYMPGEIRRGDLDMDLTKPLNLLTLYVRFDIDNIGRLITAFLMFWIAVPNINLQLSLFNILYFIFLVIIGLLAMFAVDLFVITFAFFVTNVNSIQNNLDNIRSRFCRWPMNLYPKSMQLFFTFVFPIIFIGFVPASFFLGKEIIFAYWLSPIIVIILTLLSIKWFYYGVAKYTGTGS
ncbi:hypothetical protein COX58_01765 [archaeon CG_4_10_14_0_2_um_filter_Archaea_38_6]|nr:MAG: hypothetical protein COS83_04110 [archaeon CG07_land_8_20_14_0_80_38_8]PIU88801.1 MAG: hypothetical protein COS64_02370 [archaeon CG06_land_8_20_14_3_00_37_11]PIX42264.1 MAG: hypothetical protein COZ55_02260 [archaeon CG_4_8_14_3_um_filter_38_5]PJA22577.1 MAG: hypothetical protein COX58_01765 [archaeon CG_4_10_14_0_2_um_filter_Archaea_38_6]